VGFEHGRGGHIHDESAPLHMQEYAFVDQFVVDTPYKATVLQQRIQSDLLVDPAGQIPEIVSCESNTYRKSHDSPTYYGTQPRVLYVTTAFVGETQYPLQPLMPDQLYADWQNRLVRQVQALGFQIACKSHPEGIMKGSMPHLEGVCPLLGGRFIDHVRDYDVFLFDYPATSTLWEACLTNRKIVFVDLGLAQWVPEIWADFSQRCSIVTAEYDEFGRPIVKSEALQKGLNSPFGGGAFVDRNLLGSLE